MYLRETETIAPRANELRGYLASIPSGAAGVRATLHIMRSLVRANKRNLVLRDFAARACGHLPQKAYREQVECLFGFVRDRVRYIHDIHGLETIQTPQRTLELRYGDCDDKALLLATLLESIGHPTRFVAIGTRAPDHFEHVFLETRIGRAWVALDPTEPHAMGWRPPKIVAAPMIVHN